MTCSPAMLAKQVMFQRRLSVHECVCVFMCMSVGEKAEKSLIKN